MLRLLFVLATALLPTTSFALHVCGATTTFNNNCRLAAVHRQRAAAPPLLQFAFPDDGGDDKDDGSSSGSPDDESYSDAEESAEVDAFRAQLLRQMLGGKDPDTADDIAGVGDGVDGLLGKSGGGSSGGAAAAPGPPQVRQAGPLAAGQVLLANPERFCSRNPFSRPVKDLNRFGLRGPIDDDDLDPDAKAQMLPVLLLIDHGKEGSRGLLMERRTGALMGDVSMDEYGAVAISPLWLGGTANQNSLYTIHDVEDVDGATEIASGLFLGGWTDVQPRVSDSSVSDARFKFYLGATEWKAGQLEEEIKAGAWIALDCDPALVIKDRVGDWRPGQPKPVWTELLAPLKGASAEIERMFAQVYPE